MNSQCLINMQFMVNPDRPPGSLNHSEMISYGVTLCGSSPSFNNDIFFIGALQMWIWWLVPCSMRYHIFKQWLSQRPCRWRIDLDSISQVHNNRAVVVTGDIETGTRTWLANVSIFGLCGGIVMLQSPASFLKNFATGPLKPSSVTLSKS